MTDDVESTRPDTTSTEKLSPCERAETYHHRNPAIFEEQLREINAPITAGILNLAVPPLTNSILDCADDTSKKVDFLDSKKKSTEEDKLVGPTIGPISKVGLSSMGLALKQPISHSIDVGQELRPTYSLFSIGSHTIKPSSGSGKRDVMGTIQKKKKQVRKGVGKENLMQGERGIEYGMEVVCDIVKVTNDNEVWPKRKIRAPLTEVNMEEDVGKKQKIKWKIKWEVLVLSKLMSQQLGSTVAVG